MVSSVSSLFRPRRNRNQQQPKAASVSIPTVEITAPLPEEPMTTTKTEEIVIPSTIQEEISDEKILKNGIHGEMKVVIVETDEEISHVGCSETIQNGINKMKEVVEEIPPEYKEAARYSGLVTASLAGLFVSIVLFRVSEHFLFGEEQGFFCSYFSRPFAPMFDALCHPEYPGIFKDFTQETNHLATEISSAAGNFFGSMYNGFRAFGTIFWALFGGIFHVISDGFHELFENVTENLAFLFKFFLDFTNSIISILYRMLSGTIDQLGIACQNLGRAFQGEPISSWY